MNNSILLSIIIPCWNVEKFVPNILDNLIRQKLCDDIEVILVNDGSTDNTSDIVQGYAESNTNIKFINFEQNKGVSVARNAGIENAQGKYIQFFDADDMMPDGTLDFYREFLSNKDNDIIVCGHKINYSNGKTKIIDNAKYNYNEFKNIDFLKLFFVREIYSHLCSQIYSRKFLIDSYLRFIVGVTRGQDSIFVRSAYFCAKNILCDSRIIYHYCIRVGSTVGELKVYRKKELGAFVCAVDNLEKHLKNYSEILKFGNFFLAENYIGNLQKFFRYTKEDKKEIAEALVEKKYLLSTKMCFRFPKTIVFFVLKFIPIRLFLVAYSKICLRHLLKWGIALLKKVKN